MRKARLRQSASYPWTLWPDMRKGEKTPPSPNVALRFKTPKSPPPQQARCTPAPAAPSSTAAATASATAIGNWCLVLGTMGAARALPQLVLLEFSPPTINQHLFIKAGRLSSLLFQKKKKKKKVIKGKVNVRIKNTPTSNIPPPPPPPSGLMAESQLRFVRGRLRPLCQNKFYLQKE